VSSITEILSEPSEEDLRWARKEGYQAYLNGISSRDCPRFNSLREEEEWKEGWYDAAWDD